MADVKTMGAIYVSKFGPATEVMKWCTDVPLPSPGENQVLIRVEYAGVNPVDGYIRAGNYPRLPQLPYVPGGDASGHIVALGPGVDNVHDPAGFKIGDMVACVSNTYGTYGEFCLADTLKVWRLTNTDAIHDEKELLKAGAALGVPYCTAYKALMMKCLPFTKDFSQMTVLIHGGSGAVGLAACQIAKSKGFRVLSTAGTESGMELCKKNGADLVFNHRKDGYIQEIMTATEGVKMDIILEMVANVNLPKDLNILNDNGTVVVIGTKGPVEINPGQLMSVEGRVGGVSLGGHTSQSEWSEIVREIGELWRGGVIRPIIDKVFDGRKAAEAHDYVFDSKKSSGGKVLLEMPREDK